MILKFFQQLNKTNKVYYCTKTAKNKLYSSTVLLPRTKFPLRLEGGRVVERDQYIYEVAEFENLYAWQRSHLYEPEFVLHDGPPYANGQLHMGHVINKLEILPNKRFPEQKKVFQSWGVIGDWKNYYTTYSSEYVKTQFRQFLKMYKKKLILRDYKPIHWSPSTKTALAEAELEYNENHKSPSAYIRLHVKNVPKIGSLKGKRVYAVVWTTTPWTLPSNQAVCYNETLYYCLATRPDSPEPQDIYIVASKLVNNLNTIFNYGFQKLKTVSGNLLEGATYAHPIYREKILPFLNSSHATATKGTGLVHTAPAHGHEDFLVGLSNKLQIVDIVNEEGRYKKEAGENWKENLNSVNHNCNLLDQHGTDFWWKLKEKDLLPENEYSTSKMANIVKGEDIMDIWFDSGISWAKVLEGEKVADLYLEGVDQFNGWFHASLLTSVALRDKAPYKSVYVHGFAVDEKGEKMSKSLGNVIDPVDIVRGKEGAKHAYGIDVLRWWVICHASQISLANVSSNILQSSVDEVQKVRSVLRFAISCLTDYEKSETDQLNLLLIDKYMLHLLYQFNQHVTGLIKECQFHKISAAVLQFLTNPISAVYYTAIKDRLYCDHYDSSTRRSAQYTLLQIFETVTQAIAPIVPHLAEEMYLYLTPKDKKTYFTSAHPKPTADWQNLKLEQAMDMILNIRKDINKELDATLDADITIIFSKRNIDLLKVRDFISITFFRVARFVLGQPLEGRLPKQHLYQEGFLSHPTRRDLRTSPQRGKFPGGELVVKFQFVAFNQQSAVRPKDTSTGVEAEKGLLLIRDLQTQLTDILQVANVVIKEDENLTDEYRLAIARSKKVSCLRCRRVKSEKQDELCKRCCDVVNALKINKSAIAS
ncbi:hypothetical protein NQ318_017924 [Aromia moschata]|uniref:Isoleucine--tRNA ligase n=1 Tax=Aromia moschata TaxID=1265417 RepID=A0AAV8YCT5_9CUCU|nr:hypothetical protein NQ318_017924 [Aromia moschata]